MGFSEDCFNQYRREIRIMWRVLAGAALLASGFHVFSLPFISRFAANLTGDTGAEEEAIPIEIIVEEEVVQQTPEPEPEPPKASTEPAAAAEQPSAPPLATNVQESVPTSEVASADTVAVTPAIATENGVAGGEGAVGESAAVGLVEGRGQPVDIGALINLPTVSTPVETERPDRPRARVEEISLAERRAPSSRLVSCNPCTTPDYPRTAQLAQVEGQPVINAIFDGDGNVIEARIEVSSGNEAFDRAALEEARRNWRFEDPRGVGGQVSVDVTFVVEGSEQSEKAEQAGEIRAVELPVNQQIRSVSSDAPAPSAVSEPEPISPVETAPPASLDAAAEAPPEPTGDNPPASVDSSSPTPPSSAPPAEPASPSIRPESSAPPPALPAEPAPPVSAPPPALPAEPAPPVSAPPPAPTALPPVPDIMPVAPSLPAPPANEN